MANNSGFDEDQTVIRVSSARFARKQVSSDAARMRANKKKALTTPINKQDGKDNKDVVSRIEDHAQHVRREVQFSMDKTTGLPVMNVTDSVTHDVVRQIPSEAILRVAEHMDDFKRLLINKHA